MAFIMKAEQDGQDFKYEGQDSLELLFGFNDTPFAKCDENWQKEVCDGSLMCHATKCFYPEANFAMIHRIFLESLIKNLKESDNPADEERALHLSRIAKFGMPEDNERHEFVFIDSDNIKCRYTLWQKDDSTLFFDMSGCLKNKQVMTQTLIQHEMGVIELYQHVAY